MIVLKVQKYLEVGCEVSSEFNTSFVGIHFSMWSVKSGSQVSHIGLPVLHFEIKQTIVILFVLNACIYIVVFISCFFVILRCQF